MSRHGRGHGTRAAYRYATVSVAASGTDRVVLVPAPDDGVSYRIFFVNAKNTSGGIRSLVGEVHDSTSNEYYMAFFGAAFNGDYFVDGSAAYATAEYNTIAVLDDTDETFEISLSGTGTFVVTACYEIVDETGARTFRNSMATTDGTNEVELLSAPPSLEVYRVHTINGKNTAGSSTKLSLWVGTGSTRGIFQLVSTVNNTPFRITGAAYQSPFPPFVLSGASDSLVGTLNAAGALNIITNYEVLSSGTIV